MDTYMLKNADKEVERLDDQHNGLKTYLGSNYVAPLSTIPGGPKTVLELGTGSGIWIAEIATEFPGAEVLAVDIAPVKRVMPKNVTATVMDLKGDWPWKEGQFDIVHARFVFLHLPNAPDLVKRAFTLVAPGGYILLEDPIHQVFSVSPETDPVLPSIEMFHGMTAGQLAARGLDQSIGEKYEGWLRESGQFEEVGVRKIDVPMTAWTDDANLNGLGAAMKQSNEIAYYSALPAIPEQLRAQFKAMTDKWKVGINEEGHKFYIPYYLVWGRKKSA